MKLRNEIRNAIVSDREGRPIEGIVRVRGIDARVRGRGFVFEQQQPIAVVVQTRTGVQRLAIPSYDALPGVAAVLAGPALFFATKRIFRKGRPR